MFDNSRFSAFKHISYYKYLFLRVVNLIPMRFICVATRCHVVNGEGNPMPIYSFIFGQVGTGIRHRLKNSSNLSYDITIMTSLSCSPSSN